MPLGRRHLRGNKPLREKKESEGKKRPGAERIKLMKKNSLKGIEREMYLYFVNYDDMGAPSFAKFARLKGLTVYKLLSLRTRKKFNEAYTECMEIRRDYLIDKALTKKFDGSFVKYLLDSESTTEVEEEINVKVEVV